MDFLVFLACGRLQQGQVPFAGNQTAAGSALRQNHTATQGMGGGQERRYSSGDACGLLN